MDMIGTVSMSEAPFPFGAMVALHKQAMNKYHGGVAEYRASEGKTVEVPYRGGVRGAFDDDLHRRHEAQRSAKTNDIRTGRHTTKHCL
jgi:hypothetical protein